MIAAYRGCSLPQQEVQRPGTAETKCRLLVLWSGGNGGGASSVEWVYTQSNTAAVSFLDQEGSLCLVLDWASETSAWKPIITVYPYQPFPPGTGTVPSEQHTAAFLVSARRHIRAVRSVDNTMGESGKFPPLKFASTTHGSAHHRGVPTSVALSPSVKINVHNIIGYAPTSRNEPRAPAFRKYGLPVAGPLVHRRRWEGAALLVSAKTVPYLAAVL